MAVDFSTWDQDCEAAFEVALPPQWELRERRSASSCWVPFPDAANTAINAMARRGQREGTVSLGGRNELQVDLQDMIAKSTEMYSAPRMMRKSMRPPRVDKSNVRQFYARYAEKVPPPDHPLGSDGIAGEKFLQLFEELGVDPGTDVAALALAAACDAAEMGVFRRREFICGCAAMEVDSLEGMKCKMDELRSNVLTGRSLPEVYAYTFGVALDPPSKVLPIEEAQQYWALLLPDWSLREEFCEFASKHKGGKVINRDLWSMVLKLALEVPDDFSNYDDNPAWPVLFDDFVEYKRALQA